MIDTRLLRRGQKYCEFSDSYVIFITEADVMGEGLPLYEIERVVKQTGACFGDRTHIIYINGENEDETSLGRLMHDFKCRNAEDMYYPQIADRVRYIKESEGGREYMCRIMEELNQKAAIEERKKNALAMINKGKLSYEEISEYTGLSVEEVKALADGRTA